MLDCHVGADLVEGMLAAWLLVFCGEAVGECEPFSVGILVILIGDARLSLRRKSTLLWSVMSP
jgi:hypothetical protein